MKGVLPMNRLNNCIGRIAVRFFAGFVVFSQLSLLHVVSGETVRFAGDSDLVGDNGRWTRAVAEEWAEKTNNTVEYISRPADATATLQMYLQYWGSKSADVDVFLVDLICPRIVGPYAGHTHTIIQNHI